MKLILASASPRRKELLAKTGLAFDILPAKGEEVITKVIPEEIVKELSFQKAMEIASRQDEECIVIGSDTIVAKGDKVMGKPATEEDAFAMLTEIAGTAHEVYTGVTMIKTGNDPQTVTFAEKTVVEICAMSDQEKWDYIFTKDPMDKAGAYGIQGDFAIFVKGIVGDYYNVVGLPVARVYQELKALL